MLKIVRNTEDQKSFAEKVLIIIPAFNEAESIGRVASSIRKSIPQADILVINDGSRDNTSAVARRAKATVIDHPYNMGIGATKQTGYMFASLKGYDMAVEVDADNQHPPEQIINLLKPIIEGRADFVVGSRFISPKGYKSSFIRCLGIRLFSAVISFILGQKLTDTTSGFRAINKRVIDFYTRGYPEDYPEVEELVLLHKAGFKIIEIPVEMRDRTTGTSSITFLNSLYYVVKVLLAVFIDLLKKVEKIK